MPHQASTASRAEPDAGRRRQLVETTIEVLAESGYVGTTLSRIGSRAGVSPGLIAHYFSDKDALLDAAFRTLVGRVRVRGVERLSCARTPRERVQALIDANLAPHEFEPHIVGAWLAFWGQMLHAPRLKRVQAAYQARMLSNLRHALRLALPDPEARQVAAMVAALIDGIWLRAALSRWEDGDSEAARSLVAAFVESRLPSGGALPKPLVAKPAQQLDTSHRIDGRPLALASGDSFEPANPATGEVLGRVAVVGGAGAVGDPLDPATHVGSLISQAHTQKVLGYIRRGRQKGAEAIAGGHRVTDGALAHGAFVAPTVFDGCRDDMAIVHEEIFGLLMAVLAFDEEDKVVARANATEFGLAAGVFTNDLKRAHRVIARLHAGTCWINAFNLTPIELPFGGMKQSGLGRENGRAAIEHYTQLESVYVALGDVEAPY